MKKNKLIPVLLIIVFLTGIATYGFLSLVKTNDLGLTKSDLATGELSDFEALRTKIMKAADSYLSQHADKLNELCHGSCELRLNYSLKRKIRPFGYRSSFYYSHWNIFLPYSAAEQNNKDIYILQISDENGNINDLKNKFSVIRVIVIDDSGNVVKQIEEK